MRERERDRGGGCIVSTPLSSAGVGRQRKGREAPDWLSGMEPESGTRHTAAVTV